MRQIKTSLLTVMPVLETNLKIEKGQILLVLLNKSPFSIIKIFNFRCKNRLNLKQNANKYGLSNMPKILCQKVNLRFCPSIPSLVFLKSPIMLKACHFSNIFIIIKVHWTLTIWLKIIWNEPQNIAVLLANNRYERVPVSEKQENITKHSFQTDWVNL